MSENLKHIFAFGDGEAEGSGELKFVLGGKGAGLAEMSRLGITVPPGFTLTTAASRYYHQHGGKFPPGLEQQLAEHLSCLEERLEQRFGDPRRPLLLSVRSGAPLSMPGMMDTVLNLGLTAEVVAQAAARDASFLRDCYRRLLMMYGEVVLGMDGAAFERTLHENLAVEAVADAAALSTAGQDRMISAFLALYEAAGVSFPQDPMEQLWRAVGAVFDSWYNRRAVEYRRIHEIAEDLGTGVTVQAMVFGNRGDDCATGVAFSRNPATGERQLYGEYLINAQGEDVVAGTHTPRPISGDDQGAGLGAVFPQAYADLERVCGVLERHFRNMQDLEFTIQHGRLFMLQTRAGKRSGPAAVRIAVDMVGERLIDRREALRRVEPQHLVQMMAPVFAIEERAAALRDGRLLARGLAAGPGAASGRIALDADRAAEMAKSGAVLLVRNETSPEDIVGMHAAAGILTTRGGMTSHAAVVARGLGKPCVVGAADLVVDEVNCQVRVADKTLDEGDWLSIEGTHGEIIAGALEPVPAEIVEVLLHGDRSAIEGAGPAVRSFLRLLDWADRERRLEVRANADTPADAAVARTFGAEGIGLCRTEHMFFQEDRIALVRQMILARNASQRAAALKRLLPMQQADFEGIFREMSGLPVTVRLLDPPLHEFLPHGRQAMSQLAELTGQTVEEIEEAVAALVEVNPMLGHRGCRLGITAPEIYEMQAEAIARAACRVAADGVDVRPEVMIPLTGVEQEIARLRSMIERVLSRVFAEEGREVPTLIGTMIEVPRAALMANAIARHADFFSFGTNDLTQMTYGYSRDDAGRFLPQYLEAGVVPFDPFARLDEEGVGELVKIASRRGRMADPGLKLGVCGEHGGEAHSIEFFERCGLDYVSCSPYRLPIARLAAARARLAFGAGGMAEGLEDERPAADGGTTAV